MSESYQSQSQPNPQPYIILVENKSNEAKQNFSIFGAHNSIRLIDSDGNLRSDGITVSSLISTISYNDMLWYSVGNRLGNICKILIDNICKISIDSDCLLKEDYDLVLTLKGNEPNGNAYQVPFMEKDNKSVIQKNIKLFETSFELNGGACITLNTIPPKCKIIVSLYPSNPSLP